MTVPYPTGLDALRERLAREDQKSGPLFVLSWWAAAIAFCAVTWLLLITLLFF